MGVGWKAGGADARASKASCRRTEVVFFCFVFFKRRICLWEDVSATVRGRKNVFVLCYVVTRVATVHKRSSVKRTNSQCHSL